MCPCFFIANAHRFVVLMPSIHYRQPLDKLRYTSCKMNQANRLPATWNLLERFAELLCGSNNSALATNTILWPALWENDIELLGERQVGISKPNKNDYCIGWARGR